jgi:hypothetical protein
LTRITRIGRIKIQGLGLDPPDPRQKAIFAASLVT